MSRIVAIALISPALLVASLSSADSGKPSIESSCGGYPVLTAHHIAAQYAAMAKSRFDTLSLQGKAARKSSWDAGAEKKWFGSYSESRFAKARSVIATTSAVLNGNELTVRCDKTGPNWARTWAEQFQGAKKEYFIELGKPWLFGKPGIGALELAGERGQTFVHEAAHHGGANRGEFLGRMGVSSALKRASKYPGTAVRSAENHGYYAICRASNSPACTP
jgi:hypothetical protein